MAHISEFLARAWSIYNPGRVIEGTARTGGGHPNTARMGHRAPDKELLIPGTPAVFKTAANPSTV